MVYDAPTKVVRDYVLNSIGSLTGYEWEEEMAEMVVLGEGVWLSAMTRITLQVQKNDWAGKKDDYVINHVKLNKNDGHTCAITKRISQLCVKLEADCLAVV